MGYVPIGGPPGQAGLLAVSKEELVDIRDVTVKGHLGREERIADFLAQIKNPYRFKCGDLVVESVFSDGEATLTQRLEQYLEGMGEARS